MISFPFITTSHPPPTTHHTCHAHAQTMFQALATLQHVGFSTSQHESIQMICVFVKSLGTVAEADNKVIDQTHSDRSEHHSSGNSSTPRSAAASNGGGGGRGGSGGGGGGGSGADLEDDAENDDEDEDEDEAGAGDGDGADAGGCASAGGSGSARACAHGGYMASHVEQLERQMRVAEEQVDTSTHTTDRPAVPVMICSNARKHSN